MSYESRLFSSTLQEFPAIELKRKETMRHVSSTRRAILGVLTILFSALCSGAVAQRAQRDAPGSDREVSVLVTAHPQNPRMREAALKLKADDFVVREDK